MRYFRLLPAVIVVGMALLGLKGEGLIRAAWAQDQQQGQQVASAADPLAKDTAPLPNDPAADDTHSESAAEIDVLSSLAKRRTTLDARETDIEMRSQVLAAAEARVDGKITTLKKLQDQIGTLLVQRDAEEQKQLASLVKTYSAMKSKDAARIFNNLSEDVLVAVAQQMKSDVLAPILASMSADNAQKLTLKLANRLKLPETAAQAATPAPAAAPAPAPTPAPQPAAAKPDAPKAAK
jgi:flagellar motility protein MotE (MotC chaperone)